MLAGNMPSISTKPFVNTTKSQPTGPVIDTSASISGGATCKKHSPSSATTLHTAKTNPSRTLPSNMAPANNMPRDHPLLPNLTRRTKGSYNKFAASFYFMVEQSIALFSLR
eukprot:CCRYP_014880-RK/>CCRYP_014880-RK protein AED:0.46 eAED:0.46 QI:0/0/0/1/0/0/2/0/110